jgi:hypothetical protein
MKPVYCPRHDLLDLQKGHFTGDRATVKIIEENNRKTNP